MATSTQLQVRVTPGCDGSPSYSGGWSYSLGCTTP